MKEIKSFVVSIAILYLFVPKGLSQNFHLPIREIPDIYLNDIAMSNFDMYGPYIKYNPTICNSTSSNVVLFFKYHEYGHIYLEHIYADLESLQANPYDRSWIRKSFELEADCFAAFILDEYDTRIVDEVISFFEITQGPNAADELHPTGFQRAENLRMCRNNKEEKLQDVKDVFLNELIALLKDCPNNFENVRGALKEVDEEDGCESYIYKSSDNSLNNGTITVCQKDYSVDFTNILEFENKADALDFYGEIRDKIKSFFEFCAEGGAKGDRIMAIIYCGYQDINTSFMVTLFDKNNSSKKYLLSIRISNMEED